MHYTHSQQRHLTVLICLRMPDFVTIQTKLPLYFYNPNNTFQIIENRDQWDIRNSFVRNNEVIKYFKEFSSVNIRVLIIRVIIMKVLQHIKNILQLFVKYLIGGPSAIIFIDYRDLYLGWIDMQIPNMVKFSLQKRNFFNIQNAKGENIHHYPFL